MNALVLVVILLLVMLFVSLALAVYALVRVEALHHQVVQLRTYTQLDKYDGIPGRKQWRSSPGRRGPSMPPPTAKGSGGSPPMKI